MKIGNHFNINYLYRKITIIILIAITGTSCIKEDQAYTTFTGDMIYSYLKKDTTYSEYVKLVNKAGLRGMLSAYGTYTCLAPTNSAFRKFYKSMGPKFTSDSLIQIDLEYIVKTHIIINKYLTSELQDGVISSPNMNLRYIEIKFTTDDVHNTLKIMLNDSSQIISRDNEVYNGIVQGISSVLKPSTAQLPELIAANKELSIFTEALMLTHLDDSLSSLKDKSYEPYIGFKDEYDTYPIPSPAERKYGFTVLVEDDNTFKANGINNIDDLIQKANELYPSEKIYDYDYTNRNNSLNQFISYHLIEKAIYLNKFLYTSHSTKNMSVYEFLETMLTNRIMKVTNISTIGGGKLVINPNSNQTVGIRDTGGATTINGVYHLIDNLLIYSDNVEKMLQNTRIRFDFASLFPELVNNNVRCARAQHIADGDRYGIPQGYFKYLQSTKDTRLIYLAGEDNNSWTSYQGDELMGLGSYDVTMRLIPVPPGTYELRQGYSANPLRSITQIYIDGKPIGIPLDLRITANDPRIGYLADAENQDFGYENDKMMRNRGYMKAPTSFNVYFSSTPTLARDNKSALRRIIGTFTFTDYSPHYIRLKSVINNPKAQLDLDFLEFVPKSIFSPASGDPESRD